jgi:hypothetical protein
MPGAPASPAGIVAPDLDRAGRRVDSRWRVNARRLSLASRSGCDDDLTFRAVVGFSKVRVTPKQLGFSEIGFGALTVLAVVFGKLLAW